MAGAFFPFPAVMLACTTMFPSLLVLEDSPGPETIGAFTVVVPVGGTWSTGPALGPGEGGDASTSKIGSKLTFSVPESVRRTDPLEVIAGTADGADPIVMSPSATTVIPGAAPAGSTVQTFVRTPPRTKFPVTRIWINWQLPVKVPLIVAFSLTLMMTGPVTVTVMPVGMFIPV
jgi:hypothetical protein